DMPRLTAALDIATSSSCAESFPNVIGEAMSCAVPCVVTDVSDLVWIVGETGRVVPPRNAAALANAMRELVELGPAAPAKLGRAERERMLKNFPLKEIDVLYEGLYEEVMAQRSIPAGSNVSYHEFAEAPAHAVLSETGQPPARARKSAAMGHE